MSTIGDAQKEIDISKTVDEIKETIQSDPEQFTSSIYLAMDAGARTALAYREYGPTPGWSKHARNANGSALWTPSQQQKLEGLFAHSKQSGGALDKLALRPGAYEDIVHTDAPLDLDMSKLSVDDMYHTVREKIQYMDAVGRQLTRQLGLVKFVDRLNDIKVGPIRPYLPIQIPISKRAILVLINSFLETIRVLSSSYALDVPILRQLTSFSLGILDLARGEWKDAVLTWLGLVNTNLMMMGILGKSALWVYNFISPEIQVRLENDVFAATKSLAIGFWLWIFTVLAPKDIQAQVNGLIAKATEPLKDINKKLEEVEAVAQKSADQVGAEVKFPRVPLDKIPSFDDIQNLQSLIQQPEVHCNPQVREVLSQVANTPGLRIVLELMNIPMIPEKVAEVCKDIPQDPVQAITKAFEPTVTMKENPMNLLAAATTKKIGGRRTMRLPSGSRRRSKSKRCSYSASTVTPMRP